MANEKIQHGSAEHAAAVDKANRDAPGPKHGIWPAGKQGGGKYMAEWVKPNGDTFLRKMALPGTADHESVARGLRAKGYKLA